MNNTPTPITDASSVRVCLNWENKGDHIREVVPSYVSRKLERERDEAREIIANALKALPVGYIPSHIPASIPERITDLVETIVDSERERDDAREQLETERIRLAACGGVATADTRESAKTMRSDIHSDYLSASLSDVIRRVDECINLREQLAAERALADRLAGTLGPYDGGTSSKSYAAWKEARK